jgi:predicted hotdog family 3-hydroxylacyl-ACP dehydratase
MSAHVDNPFVTLAIALVAQAIAAYVGDFLRIADLDSLRGGVIRVQPQNLLAMTLSIKP